MDTSEHAQLIRIFIGEEDHTHGKPLYEEIVHKAREQRMAGVTVVRGIMGFGADAHLHTAKVLRLSENLPIIIEIVDKPDKIAAFLPTVEPLIQEGLITMEEVQARFIRTQH